MTAMNHYLLVYSYDEQRLIDMQVFKDGDAATRAYRDVESTYRGRYDSFEVVLVGAESEETIHRTHGHYFLEPSEQESLQDLLA